MEEFGLMKKVYKYKVYLVYVYAVCVYSVHQQLVSLLSRRVCG